MKISVIDVGGTFIKYACMNEKSEILSRGKIPTPQDTSENFINALVDIYKSMPDVEGMALSLPGIIDSKNGHCVTCGALHYNDNFYVEHAIKEKIPDLKVSMENDAKCAGMAEASVGALKDVEDGFVLVFGTGIGGAFIKNHTLHRGHHFSAGEVSFILTDKDAPQMINEYRWGNQCGVPQLCALYAERKNLKPDEVDCMMVFEAVNNGDPVALKCLDLFTRRIAIQIFNIQMLLDPQRFAIGGGISVQPAFIEHIRKYIDELANDTDLYFPKPEIVVCQFQNDANLIGALQCYLERFVN